MHIYNVFIKTGKLTAEWPKSMLGRTSVDAIKSVRGKLSAPADEVADLVHE